MQVKPSVAGNRRRGVSALLRVADTTSPQTRRDSRESRRLVVDFCRLMLGEKLLADDRSTTSVVTPRGHAQQLERPLAPRVQQTLTLLLQGEGEKQIARILNLSKHTVHVYVKSLYKAFDVCTRSELMARFVNASVQPD